MTKEEIKALAKSLGADAVGIASMDRFEGAPKQMDPRYIMPEAKSMIVMLFRVMRGSLRGIEEGTFFSNYSAMGYGGLTYNYIPMTVINLCKHGVKRQLARQVDRGVVGAVKATVGILEALVGQSRDRRRVAARVKAVVALGKQATGRLLVQNARGVILMSLHLVVHHTRADNAAVLGRLKMPCFLFKNAAIGE